MTIYRSLCAMVPPSDPSETEPMTQIRSMSFPLCLHPCLNCNRQLGPFLHCVYLSGSGSTKCGNCAYGKKTCVGGLFAAVEREKSSMSRRKKKRVAEEEVEPEAEEEEEE